MVAISGVIIAKIHTTSNNLPSNQHEVVVVATKAVCEVEEA